MTEEALAHGRYPGFVLWFTGLSGSGKTTLSRLVARELENRGIHVEVLDGDEVRAHLSQGLGFSKEDRDENIRRVGYVAGMVARCGACAIVAVISPYEAARRQVRNATSRFVEVYTECPLDTLVERDPKGLYRRALEGKLPHFTGVDDPYEAPVTPEVHLRTDQEQPGASRDRVVSYLEEHGFVPGSHDEPEV